MSIKYSHLTFSCSVILLTCFCNIFKFTHQVTISCEVSGNAVKESENNELAPHYTDSDTSSWLQTDSYYVSDDSLFSLFSQIAESDVPGVFNAFAMMNNELHSIKINVPRIFYVNSKKMKEGEGASKSLKVLFFFTILFRKCLAINPSASFVALVCSYNRFSILISYKVEFLTDPRIGTGSYWLIRKTELEIHLILNSVFERSIDLDPYSMR